MEIQLKKREGYLKIDIKDEEGNLTGEFLEFDFNDISIPFKYQQLIDDYKKNRAYLKNQFAIIDKKQDHKGKKLMSSNEELKIKALHEYYEKQMTAYNTVLGENGCEKLLNGRHPYWTMFDDIDEYMKEILPLFEETTKNLENTIMKKYKINNESDVLE